MKNLMIFFTEYGNIGYHSSRNHSVPLDLDDVEANAHNKSIDIKKCDQMKPVVPIQMIDLPD